MIIGSAGRRRPETRARAVALCYDVRDRRLATVVTSGVERGACRPGGTFPALDLYALKEARLTSHFSVLVERAL
jgi:hypothetical protein